MAETFNPNPSPKTLVLIDKKWIEAHRNLLQLPIFDRSINQALLEYQRVLVHKAKDGNESAAAHYKMTGALEFLNLFKNLAEPVNVAPKPQTANTLQY